MKSALFISAYACICIASVTTEARAEEDTRDGKTTLASQNDFGFDLDFAAHWAQRFHGRAFLIGAHDEPSTYQLDYGLSWKPRAHFSIDLTAGYAYTTDRDARHALVIGLWKHMGFLKDTLSVDMEGLHWYDGRYRYEGFYAVNWYVIGAHVMNRNSDAAAGFQIGSGPGLLPFRFDVRISFGLTDGMPDRIGCFVMNFDLR